MNSRIRQLLEEIQQLEGQLAEMLQQQELKLLYRLDGTRVQFEKTVEEAHRRLKTGTVQWLLDSELRNIVSAPVIYLMVVPFALLDLTLSVYQWICFPLYQITRVRRADYLVLDRHHLSYLNGIEKLNCVYCGYITGIMGYGREIVARTEQYWCPIKHARRVLDPHKRYARFADFGDTGSINEHRDVMRIDVREVGDEPGEAK